MIRQFDVCRNPGPKTSLAAPYVCVLQSHYLDAIETVVVAPMLLFKARPTPSQVAVPVEFDGETYLLDMSFIANLERRKIGRATGSLAALEDDIRRALDRLFTGF